MELIPVFNEQHFIHYDAALAPRIANDLNRILRNVIMEESPFSAETLIEMMSQMIQAPDLFMSDALLDVLLFHPPGNGPGCQGHGPAGHDTGQGSPSSMAQHASTEPEGITTHGPADQHNGHDSD